MRHAKTKHIKLPTNRAARQPTSCEGVGVGSWVVGRGWCFGPGERGGQRWTPSAVRIYYARGAGQAALQVIFMAAVAYVIE